MVLPTRRCQRRSLPPAATLCIELLAASLLGGACATSSSSTRGTRFFVTPGASYLMSTIVAGQIVEGVTFLPSGDLAIAGFGFESCQGPATADAARVSGRLLASHLIPMSKVRQTDTNLRVECPVVRLNLRRGDDGLLEGTVSFLLSETTQRATGAMEVRRSWTPAMALELTARGAG